jgi:hypothetical protein
VEKVLATLITKKTAARKTAAKKVKPRGLTLGEMRDLFEYRQIKGGGLLLRPTHAGVEFLEVNLSAVLAALDHIAAKVGVVQAGIDEFNPAETLCFMLLKAAAENY